MTVLRLRTGRVAAELRPGGAGLRDIAVDGTTVFRGIDLVALDPAWGTFNLRGHTEMSPSPQGLEVRATGRIVAAPSRSSDPGLLPTSVAERAFVTCPKPDRHTIVVASRYGLRCSRARSCQDATVPAPFS